MTAPNTAYAVVSQNDARSWSSEAGTRFARLTKLNQWLAVPWYAAHGTASLVLCILKISYRVQLFLDDSTASGDAFNAGYLVPVAYLLAMVGHFLVAWRPNIFLEDVQAFHHPVRWATWGASNGTLLLAVAVLTGTVDYAALVAIFVLYWMSMHAGWAQEATVRPGNKPHYGSWVVSLAGQAGVWTIIGLAFFRSFVGQLVWIKALFFTSFALFCVFPTWQLVGARGVETRDDLRHLRLEQWALFIGLVVHAAVGWLIIGGLLLAAPSA